MNIIFLSQHCKKWGSIEMGFSMVLAGLLIFSSLILAAGGWIGYQIAMKEARESGMASFSDLKELIDLQKAQFADLKEHSTYSLDALAVRVGEVYARMARIDALGERLTSLGKLEKDEFNFSEQPAMGGVDNSNAGDKTHASELVTELDNLTATIEDRSWKLDLLEALIMNRKLQQEVQPSGQPVKRGWITSRFGGRADPFTGSKGFHEGVDIMSQEGAPIVAVASGLVTFSGVKNGYGNVVDVMHGNGFVTRYGHNQKNIANVGETVTKGQTIALVGSTGRSTGNHVHFEVRKDDVAIDPVKYLRQDQ